MKMNTLFAITFCILWLAGCGGEVTKVGNPSSDTASLTSLASLPELDFSRYDTSSANFSNPSALALKKVTNTGEFSRVGCDSKSSIGDMQEMGLFTEGFLCLYKMAEEHYADVFSIPEGGFNYYAIVTEDDEAAVLGRIGYYPDGFGDISEPVLVLDECQDDSRTAEMRVTADTVNADLTGSGYFILLTEVDYLGDDEGTTDESISFTMDTRGDVWELAVDYHHDNDGIEYGNYAFTFDTVNIFNTFIAATHDDDPEGVFDISNNVVFGPWTEIEGFSIGGSAIVNVILSPNQDPELGQNAGFVFNDSDTLPAIRLDYQEENGADLPFYTELTALGTPPTAIEDPVISYRDDWDCQVPEGESTVLIDLTPDDIAADLFACESVGDEEEALDCAALEDLNNAE